MTALNALFAAELPDNACRFTERGGHVESYFLRANHPTRPYAFWLKQTILAPLNGPPVAESWFVWFDGERKRTIAQRETSPWSAARYSGGHVDTPAITVELGASGAAKGVVTAPEGKVSFDLSWTSAQGPVAKPLAIIPWRLLRVGPFPKSKVLTPFPWLSFSGCITLPDETIKLDGWPGMQGHNWGAEHAFDYAWGQCLFPAEDTMVEGFSGRVRIGGLVTPRLSALVVRRGGRCYRFDRLFDTWRQEATLGPDRWSLTLRSADGEAQLTMDSSNRPVACLGYFNPDGALSYCLNSKLAEVDLTVRPSDGASFTCHSDHGGALEFLCRDKDDRFSRAV